MAGYQDVIEKAIDKEKGVLSEDAALDVARDTDGLELDENGNVSAIHGSGEEVLTNLINNYVDIAGKLVPRIVGSALTEEDFGGEKVPDILADYVE